MRTVRQADIPAILKKVFKVQKRFSNVNVKDDD